MVGCPLQRTTGHGPRATNPQSPSSLARFPILNTRPLAAIVEGMSDNPKTRRATRKAAAAGKAGARKGPATKRWKTPRPVPDTLVPHQIPAGAHSPWLPAKLLNTSREAFAVPQGRLNGAQHGHHAKHGRCWEHEQRRGLRSPGGTTEGAGPPLFQPSLRDFRQDVAVRSPSDESLGYSQMPLRGKSSPRHRNLCVTARAACPG